MTRIALDALNLSPDVAALNGLETHESGGGRTSQRPAGRGSEHAEQAALIRMAAAYEARHPALCLLFAIPNGGARHPAVAGKLKAEGVRRGVPDLCLPVPHGGYAGLWIEMKYGKNTTSPEQDEWIAALRRAGHHVEVCRSAEAALAVLLDYLEVAA